jgi:syntaxin 1B/2/3
LDQTTEETNNKIQSVRSELQAMSQYKDSTRKVRQTRIAKRLQTIITTLSQVQKEAKQKQQRRLEREYKIARPDLNESEIHQLVENGVPGQAFQVANQKRVLQQVKDRHQELLNIEKSIEELATLFMDLQTLLMVNGID